MTPKQKIEIDAYRLIGDYIGTLKGICAWEIPDELKLILEDKIQKLERTRIVSLIK